MWRMCGRRLIPGGKWKMREKRPGNGVRKCSSDGGLKGGIFGVESDCPITAGNRHASGTSISALLTESSLGRDSHRSKKIDQIPVRVPEQQRAITPGHCGGGLNQIRSYQGG